MKYGYYVGEGRPPASSISFFSLFIVLFIATNVSDERPPASSLRERQGSRQWGMIAT